MVEGGAGEESSGDFGTPPTTMLQLIIGLPSANVTRGDAADVDMCLAAGEVFDGLGADLIGGITVEAVPAIVATPGRRPAIAISLAEVEVVVD